MINSLVKRLFNFSDPVSFKEVPTDEDPRGYIEVYGDELDGIHSITGAYGEVFFRALSTYWDHFTVEINNKYLLEVYPERIGLRVDVFPLSGERECISKSLHKVQEFDLFEFIYDLQNLHSTALTEEVSVS